jgi:hypothetical protein
MSEEITYRYGRQNVTLPEYLTRFKAIDETVTNLKAALDDPSFEWSAAEQKVIAGCDMVEAVGIQTRTEDERRLGQMILFLEKDGYLCRRWREECNSDNESSRCELCGSESGKCLAGWKEVEKMLFMFIPRHEQEQRFEYRGPKTNIDSLYPVADAIRKKHPRGFTMNGIHPTDIGEVVEGMRGEVVVVGRVARIMPSSLNAENKVKRRGGRRITGPHMVLNLSVNGDRPVDILCQVGRFEFARLAGPITDHGKAGKAIWGFRGVVPRNYRMLYVKQAVLIGDLDRWNRLAE